MIPVSYYAPGEHTSPMWAYAFAKGCGGTISEETEIIDRLLVGENEIVENPPVALFAVPARWSILKQAEARGRDYYYGDHAYFGRGRYYRITRNAYQHDGRGIATPDRFLTFGRPVQPWRRTGTHVLLCPQSAVYCQMHGFEVQEWLKQTMTTLRRYTDRAIRIRWKKQGVPIARDLIDAWAVVVYSSAAALDALMAGIPVFVLAPFAASARMGLSDLSRIESPIYPEDREPFLWALAWHQWTLTEIYEGHAWRALQAEARYAA